MINKRRALFLDRDGVINVDHGYVHLPEQFEFVEGVFDLCRKAQDLNYILIVITNQAGIGRGYYTEKQFDYLTDWMCNEFLEQGVKITKVYFCPYHPEHGIEGYKRESIFRKPGAGMILEAAKTHNIDLSNSVLVGDKETDIQAGEAAGIRKNILFSPHADISKVATSDSGAIRAEQLQDIIKHLSVMTEQ